MSNRGAITMLGILSAFSGDVSYYNHIAKRDREIGEK